MTTDFSRLMIIGIVILKMDIPPRMAAMRIVQILVWCYVITTTNEAASLGQNCNEATPCGYIGGLCNASKICVCDTGGGYGEFNGECKSNSITVSLSGPGSGVLYGSSTSLTVTITTAVAATSVAWQKVASGGSLTSITVDSTKYTQTGDPGSGTVILTINNINYSDEASYQVQVTNGLGITNTSKQVEVDVTGDPPSVSVSGPTQSGDTVTNGCTATVTADSPAITAIKWTKDGTEIDIANSGGKYSGGTVNNPALIINTIGSSDRGVYRCVATNAAGFTTSYNNVNLIPPGVTISGLHPSVEYGEKATLVGSYGSVLEVTSIKWQKIQNGSPKDINISDGKYSGSIVTGKNPQLVINSANFNDRGLYQMEVSNGVGSSSSNPLILNVTGGNLAVVIVGTDLRGRYGGSVMIECNVTGPEVRNILWKKYRNSNFLQDITIDGTKYTGGSVPSPSVTINSLTTNDAGQYQCIASNPGGTYSSDKKATVTVVYGQFNEDCTDAELCDSNEHLTCYISDSKCFCDNDHYHNNQICYPRFYLTPTIIKTSSTTSNFSVFWNHPSTDYNLFNSHSVSWKASGSSLASTESTGRAATSYTVSSGIVSGQLYIVTVSSVVGLTNPISTIYVSSQEWTVRLYPHPPGSILNSSSFAYNNLILKWTPPSNTIITKYEVTIDQKSYNTTNNNPLLSFTEEFTPGKYHDVSIVTISGASIEEKRSTTHRERIRITQTKPDPPTNLACPQQPKDISLEISWMPPTNPNGQIVRYQIHVNLGDRIIDTPNNATSYNVVGLSPEKMYNFTVRTINDAVDTKNVSDSSGAINCSTKAGVSSPPTQLSVNEVQSRGFQVRFGKPEIITGQLAAYKIIILEGLDCVQQIIIEGNCPQCMSTNGCPYTKTETRLDITKPVIYPATGLKPYTKYIVKVAAVNGNGEGRFSNATAKTDEEIPQKPGQIAATHIEAKSLTLSWSVAYPSPGNTTYTIYVYEGTDDTGMNFNLRQPKLNTYGFYKKSASIDELEEYWPYRFKVDASTIKGNTTSDLSNIVRTKQAAPEEVENFTVKIKDGDYRMAYVYWNIPSPKNRNGVLQSYHFSIRHNHTGTEIMGTIPVSLTTQLVEKNFTVEPEEVYSVTVYVTNNESVSGQEVSQNYRVPAGPPPLDNNKELITTRPGDHKPSLQTITVEVNTDFFKNDLNGKQVFFGIAVCEKSKCASQGTSTVKREWEGLPNWHKASKAGFPLYRVTSEAYMENIRSTFTGSRWKRSSSSEFIIGEDTICPLLDSYVYCNGPLNPGQSYSYSNVIVFACTNGGCTHSEQIGPYNTLVVEKIEGTSNLGVIVGSITGVIVLLVIVVLVYRKGRNRKNQNDANTYADLEFSQRFKDEQVYLKLDRGIRPKKTSIPINLFVSHVEDLMKDSKLKICHEFSNILLSNSKGSTRIGQSKNNVPKNRSSIVPYDFNRVKLLEGGKGSQNDYINASFILTQHYIITQYPLPKTIGHFWQMVWEQNVPTIVVLSDDSNDNIKGDQYFPVADGAVLSMGGIDVELLATFNILERASLRKIRLSKNSFLRGKELKNVNHYQMYGLNMANLSEELLSCISLIKSNEKDIKDTGPFIVHGGCSGTDYSGVFISTDYLVKSVEAGARDVDVYGTALSVMNERMLTINTEEQYSTIYTCLQKYFVSKAGAKTCDEDFERKSTAGTYEYLP
ncbi:phosphatidylinositol phosphatase PTPRQ-like [Saccostrea echinata]|uniref:phosphatidylinositol phosphatase PTPRQ-like n=1 Tax=Saccostrea echinata TaxID=191078 RepID=UPI002A83E54B|nr:phosphatidylinositol phosphatase PTPRQ-like [Saccostrea echinata]